MTPRWPSKAATGRTCPRPPRRRTPLPRPRFATAAYDTLTGLQPQLGADQTILDDDYTAYMAAIPDGTAVEHRAKRHGIAIGAQVAQAILALRANDGRERNPTLADLGPPPPGPAVWQAAPGVVLGLRLPGMKPLALTSASQFRLDGPDPLTSRRYAKDLNQVPGRGARPPRQHHEDAGADEPGPVLDRP